MTGMATLEQIQRMPKLELHIHLEGTFDPETVCLLAEMQGISLPRPRQHLFDFSGLSDFLDLLDWICSLVQNRETAQQIPPCKVRPGAGYPLYGNHRQSQPLEKHSDRRAVDRRSGRF
jgi:hypothetical protein